MLPLFRSRTVLLLQDSAIQSQRGRDPCVETTRLPAQCHGVEVGDRKCSKLSQHLTVTPACVAIISHKLKYPGTVVKGSREPAAGKIFDAEFV